MQKMKKIDLRDYQKECLDTIYETFKKTNKQIIILPTGSGKTVIFSEYIKNYSRKTLIICPSIELKEQIYTHLISVIHDRKIICEDRYRNKKPDIFVTTAQSLNFASTSNYLISIDFDTIIIDEAHHAQSKTYIDFIKKFENHGHKFNLLGFTATPERLDGKCLLDIFKTFSFEKSLIYLIENGYITDIESSRIKTHIKISSPAKTRDFTPAMLAELDIETRNISILKTYQENCINKKTLIFCLNISHSIKMAKKLKEHGYRAEFIHGKLSHQERRNILNKYKTGEIEVLTNCQVLTEGFDEPSIKSIIIARPTCSKSLYCQMVGRGLRLYPGKEVCEIYELTDNCHNICSFKTLLENENLNENLNDYPNKTRIRELRDLLSADFDEIEITKTKFSIFENEIIINSLYDFKFSNIEQTESIKNQNIDEKYNFLETLFIIWKQKLKERYGFD